MMRNRIVVAAALLVAILTPGYTVAQSASAQSGSNQGELSQADVDEALDRRRQATASLESMTARFEQAMADEAILRERITDLALSVSRLEREIGERRVEVRNLVRERYMAGGPLGTERFFAASTFTDLPVQNQYYELISDADLVLLRSLEAAEALQVERQGDLDRTLGEQEAVVAELTVLAEELSQALADADTEYQTVAAAFAKQEEERRRREEEERRRLEEEARRRAAEAAAAATSTTSTTSPGASDGGSGDDGQSDGESGDDESTDTSTTTTTRAPETTTTAPPETTTTTQPPPPPPVVTDGKTCPINAATSFSDTWGAPRSGGRTHKGVDMIAARNAPIVAIESGRVTRTSNSSLGGLSIYLTGSSGSRYYYAHLEYIEGGISSGTSVSAGQLLGGNGSTGNAPDWLPHLHFQYAPPGSDWVNPYPLVKALCG